MFSTVLVANRGEIASRIIRTLRQLNIAAIGMASDADRFTRPVREADRVMPLGAGTVAETYLDIDKIVAAARESGAEAVHPGYGFLSENVHFAERLAEKGITFIGPAPRHIRAFGTKHSAREIAIACGISLLPGSGLLTDVAHALRVASDIGYPVMLKSTAGGGGIGMQLCRDADELAQRFAAIARMAAASFGDARLYLERLVASARHVEVQIFGDGKGGVVTLGVRDCSAQRRNQKVLEETPAPNLPASIESQLYAAAAQLARAVRYESAGTVEFIYDMDREAAYFLEVNTRLQVEHPVTEEVFGVDLVEWMIRQAAGDFILPSQDTLIPRGCAIEARLYAEDPARDFRPSAGLLTQVTFPDDARVETWVETGTEISPYYDPLLAKLIVFGADRTDALKQLQIALGYTALWGIETNLSYLKAIASSAFFSDGHTITASLKDLAYRPARVDVIAPGTQSSLQDWPGRLGYWAVGIPPSGPMDDRSHRLVNEILGNTDNAATLECTLNGPTLKFLSDCRIALGGADMAATLDGVSVPLWQNVSVRVGQTLTLGRVDGPGMRTYLGVAGGFDAPLYLGARATFALGGFGGHGTGVLQAGDCLHFAKDFRATDAKEALSFDPPKLTQAWEIGVLYGPHGAPDFFTLDDIETLFSATYEVHFNSARTGVRLIGPKPRWARADGGEAGLHPSNIHDNAYAVGAIDFTGDMPIILGPDGPSLGGFVSPAAVAQGELWKLGQLKPGDTVRFHAVTLDDAHRLKNGEPVTFAARVPQNDILRVVENDTHAVYRRAGDDNVLVEYGPLTLDFTSRLRVHLLMQALETSGLPGLIDVTPGIRSLQIHYDNDHLSEARLLDALVALEHALPDPTKISVPSRKIRLPLSWNDENAQLAMCKYQELVRPNAPWCPSNIEFIRRINGLEDEDAVKRIVFSAEYLVLGLGDVYLGAPVATPIDPRHRLVTTKYNPARTWTPENAVGIGGAYLCVYGMEGPGGYQLVGRTIQMWNRWYTTRDFVPGKPWLLRFFDRITFFPVSGEELVEARAAFPHGGYPLHIEDGHFSLAEHRRALAPYTDDIAAFKARQQKAFDAERENWRLLGLDAYIADDSTDPITDDATGKDETAVFSPVSAVVWKIEKNIGDPVKAGETLLIVEAMKMEISVVSPADGIMRGIRCQRGKDVRQGQILAVIGPIP